MFRTLSMTVFLLVTETSCVEHKSFNKEDEEIVEQATLYLPLHPSEPTKLYVLNTQLKHIAEALQEKTLPITHPSKEGSLGTMTIAHSIIQIRGVKTSVNKRGDEILFEYYPIASMNAADVKIDLDDQAVDDFLASLSGNPMKFLLPDGKTRPNCNIPINNIWKLPLEGMEHSFVYLSVNEDRKVESIGYALPVDSEKLSQAGLISGRFRPFTRKGAEGCIERNTDGICVVTATVTPEIEGCVGSYLSNGISGIAMFAKYKWSSLQRIYIRK